jgi:glutamate dehydrogenase
MRPIWREIEALDNQVPADLQAEMLLEGRRLVERATRWLIRNRRRPLDIAATVEHFAPGAAALYELMPRPISEEEVEPLARRADELREAGVPPELALRVATLPTMFATLDIVDIAGETGIGFEPLAMVHFRIGARLSLHWLRDQIVALPRADRWSALARAALRDDLYSLHRALTLEVVRATDPDLDADDAVDRWIEANPASERTLQTLADIRAGRVYDLTTLPVAVREVRSLIQAAPEPAATR